MSKKERAKKNSSCNEKTFIDQGFNQRLYRLFTEGQQGGAFRRDLGSEATTMLWTSALRFLLKWFLFFESNSEQHDQTGMTIMTLIIATGT
ncbi:MAG: hypothetical protein WCS90_02625 [Bacilli bacterium]